MTSKRMVEESPVDQGEDERIAYEFDWTKMGSPTGGTCVIYDMATWTSLGTNNLTGLTTTNGTTITSPTVFGIQRGKHYQLNCVGTVSGNTFSAFVEIVGEV